MARGQNLTALIMPQFAYKKGQLYIASRTVEDIFINRGLQIEYNFAILFNEKSTIGTTAPWCTMGA